MEKFSYEANGYNRSEVNQFVGDVIRETEGIITRVKKQNAEIEDLKKELMHYNMLYEKVISKFCSDFYDRAVLCFRSFNCSLRFYSDSACF